MSGLVSIEAQEAYLDKQEDRLTEAHMTGALSDSEYQTMIRQLDRERMALMAREEAGDE